MLNPSKKDGTWSGWMSINVAIFIRNHGYHHIWGTQIVINCVSIFLGGLPSIQSPKCFCPNLSLLRILWSGLLDPTGRHQGGSSCHTSYMNNCKASGQSSADPFSQVCSLSPHVWSVQLASFAISKILRPLLLLILITPNGCNPIFQGKTTKKKIFAYLEQWPISPAIRHLLRRKNKAFSHLRSRLSRPWVTHPQGFSGIMIELRLNGIITGSPCY